MRKNKKKSKSISMMRKAAIRMLALVMALAVFAGMALTPVDTYAAAKKSKTTYSIKVHNINSNTVLKKGTKLQIQYTATKKVNGVKSGTKVKFKSSNKKVATVTKKGVIKAKKKGTVKITVYCKAKKSKKKTIKIKVGTPVSSISVSGYRYLRKGKSNTLKASCNSGATNKNVSWWSDNTAVATVNSSGKVTAKSNGVCTIYAKAKDGSGVTGSRKVYVHQYTAGDAKWIAHRGLHTSAKENTAAAFAAAGQAGGFWGCECDIWESAHVTYTAEALPEDPDPAVEPEDPEQPEQTEGTDVTEGTGDGGDAVTGSGEDGQQGTDGDSSEDPQEPEEDTAVTAAVSSISALELTGAETIINAVDKRTSIEAAKAEYDALDASQKYQVRLALQTTDADTGAVTSEGLQPLMAAIAKIKEYDSIDFPINHDSTFSSVWGNGSSVRSLTAAQINSALPGVCFLDGYGSSQGYLDICKIFGMVPVIELKDPYMSDEAVKKAMDMIDAKCGLDNVVLISFYVGVLSRAKTYVDGLGKSPETYYLMSDDKGAADTKTAYDYGFTGVSVTKSILENIYPTAKAYGLKVGTWTYRDKLEDDTYLYKHVVSGAYALDFATLDYKAF